MGPGGGGAQGALRVGALPSNRSGPRAQIRISSEAGRPQASVSRSEKWDLP